MGEVWPPFLLPPNLEGVIWLEATLPTTSSGFYLLKEIAGFPFVPQEKLMDRQTLGKVTVTQDG